MELLDLKTRRNVKPVDIFRAHPATAAGTGSSPSGENTLAASIAVRRHLEARCVGAKSGMFRGHKPFSTRTGTSYHWGVSRRQKTRAEEGGELEHMERLQIGVMDAIHDALSKEALVKKLIPPFNEDCKSKHKVSQWEWQKNTALLELEQRNQQLHHRLREATKQVMEAQIIAQHDRNRLKQALQKGKDELYLIGRAEAMRTRIIEQKVVITRSQTLYLTVFSWQRYCQDCRKKRTLKKSQSLWRRSMLMKRFDSFIHGCEIIKYFRQVNEQSQSLWVKKYLGQCFQSWLMLSRRSKEVKRKVTGFLRTWTICRLAAAYDGWRKICSRKRWKQRQLNRAGHISSFSQLRKAWHGWNLCVVLAKDKICYAKDFMFQRLVGDCFSEWRRYVRVKLQRNMRSALCMILKESKLHQITFRVWKEKSNLAVVVREREAHFVNRCERRLQQLVLTKWHHLVLGSRYLRSVEKVLGLKSGTRSKRLAFLELRRRTIRKKVSRRSQTLRMVRIRLAVFWSWRAKVNCWRDAERRLVHIQKRVEHRWQRTLFSFWVIYAAESRKCAIAKEANKLADRVKVLETNLQGAKQIRHQLYKLVVECDNEKTQIINSAQRAVVRTPVWTSGFLDVQLRWRTPLLAWFPPARAGHTAVSLPGKDGTYSSSRVVLFGGYNGEEYFNHVLIFDTGEMHWKAPAPSAVEGSVIPPPMQTHTACAFENNKMVLFGGYDGEQEFSEVSLLIISEDGCECFGAPFVFHSEHILEVACQWSQLQFVMGAKPGPVCQHTSCLYEDGPYMVVFGGYRSGVGVLNELWVLDLHWLQWTCPEYLGNPPAPCRGHGAAIIGTRLYIFGGYNGREHLADLHALDVKTMTWEYVDGQGQGPSPRRQHSVTVVGQHLVVYGGYDGQRYLGDVFTFDTVHRRWKQWPDLDTQLSLEEVGQGQQAYGRSMHTMVEGGQRLIIFGGVHEWGALQDTVFLENAAAVDGLQLQTLLVEELQKVTELQAQVKKYQKVLAKTTTELVTTQTTLEQLRSTLQVESEKRNKAVQGHRVLTKKLQQARSTSE